MTTPTPTKPRPDFPLFPHRNGQWAKKIDGKTQYFGPWSDPAAAEARYRGSSATPKVASGEKPPKPSEDFPLFAHDSGQWAKKVRGKLHYFGVWSDSDAALARWNAEKDDLLAGRVRQNGDALTLLALANKFLNSKRRQVESGELEQRTWHEYETICKKVVAVLGKETLVLDLRPDDFERLRTAFSKGVGPVALGSKVSRARVLFNYAYKHDLIDRPVKFGQGFSKPKRAVLRKERKRRAKRLFAASEIRSLIAAARPQVKAMIYLGINCGLGNTDCARLTFDHFDLETGWLDYPRPKTGIDRRCPLWPETVTAIKEAMAARPEPADMANANRVFITAKGFTWEPKVKGWSDAPLSKEIAKLMKDLEFQRKGVNFYSLRHTFQTVAEKTLDKDAVRYIMGHVESASDMSAVYSEERPDDKRLRKVAKRVRKWLLNQDTVSRQQPAAADAA